MKNVSRLRQYKTKEFEHCFCQYLKNNISDIRLIPLDNVTYLPSFYQQIRDGSTSSSPYIAEYCGNTLPGTVVTTGNSMWVEFYGDEDSDGSVGFQATYRQIGKATRFELGPHIGGVVTSAPQK